jgi:prepilin-type N-terminal cleavage/methylation domain-containing protein
VQAFTLIELLAATALFSVLGGMLFQMVQGGMDLWSRGERVRDLEERAGAVFDLMTEDLHHVWCGLGASGEQSARFLVEEREVDHDRDGAPELKTTVLRFSRLLHEQRSLPWLRHAGDRPGAERALSLSGEEDPAELLPTGGLAESLYTCALMAGEELPVLLRRVRSPLGGAGSLLEPELLDQGDRMQQDALRLVDRVLHFGVRCWSPDTTAWEALPASDDVSALRVWDSTRGLFDPDDPAFPYGMGEDSLLDGHDDMFPPVVQIVLILDPFQEDRVAPGQLALDVGPDATRVRLVSGRLGGDDRVPDAIWIGGEWLGVTSRINNELVVERGLWGTAPRQHAQGSPVRVGRRFERVVVLPTARENFDR